MKKNKKLLMSFLAVNAIISSYTGAAPAASIKYDKMFDNMAKNIEKGKSNEENYKLIERVLNQRNKELKDLYVQSDYIVKPEYLEWQIFFSGFYDERNRGDNTGENARYYSDPSKNNYGYYDANGNYVVTGSKTDGTAGKPYADPQSPKDIDLGVSIPMKGITRASIAVGVTNPSMPAIAPSIPSTVIPTPVMPSVPQIDSFSIASITTPGTVSPVTVTAPTPNTVVVNGFSPVSPVVVTPVLFTPPSLTYTAGGFGQTTQVISQNEANQGFMLGNFGVVTANTPVVVNASNFNTAYTGNIFADGSMNPYGTYGFISGNLTGGAYNNFMNAFYSMVGNFDTVMSGDYTVNNTRSDGRTTIFISYNPYEVNTTTKQVVFNGTVTLNNSLNGGQNVLVGVEHQLLGCNNGGAFSCVGNIGNAPSRFENSLGSQIILNSGINMIGIMIDSEGTQLSQRSETINNGEIIIAPTASQSIGIDFGQYQSSATQTAPADPFVIVRSGNIIMNGSNSYGLRVGNMFPALSTYYNNVDIDGSNGMIQVNGTQNVGVSLSKQITKNVADPIGNILNLRVILNGDKGVGILRNTEYAGNTNAITLNSTNVQDLILGDNAANSTLIRSDKYGIILDRNITVNNTSAVNTALNNIVMTANDVNHLGGQATYVRNNAVITLGNNLKNTTGLLSIDGGHAENTGTIIINGEQSQGISVFGANGLITPSTGINTGIINITGEESVGVYNAGTFSMTGGTITSSAKNAIGVYADNTIGTTISGGQITGKTGGMALYSGDNSTINISGSNILKAESGGLLFYNYINSGGLVTGGYNITAPSTGDVDAGGMVLYAKVASISDVSTVATAIKGAFTGASNLTLNMANGSSVFFIDTPGAAANISDFSAIPDMTTGFFNFVGTGYKQYAMNGFNLTLDNDTDSNLDTGAYGKIQFLNSSVTVAPGVHVMGTGAGQVAIAQKNSAFGVVADRLLTNNGTIELTGNSTTGIAGDFATISNSSSGTIKIGTNSVGIYTANGSLTGNSGIIELGTGSVGIYGRNYFDGVTKSSVLGYGNDTINITNENSIRTTAGGVSGDAFGIYAVNSASSPAIPASSSSILLTSTSDIKLEGTGKIIGTYLEKSNVINFGKITVTNTGTDAAVGVYLGSGSIGTLNTGQIEVTGGTGDKGIGVYVSDSAVVNNGTIKLNKNGIGIYSIESFGNTATGENGTLGEITLGTDSLGMYALGTGGGTGEVRNLGLIESSTVSANNAMGMYISGTGTGTNTGIIKLTGIGTDNNIVGIYNEGTFNMTSGQIEVSSANGTGLYAKSGSTTTLSGGKLTAGAGTIGLYADNTAINMAGGFSVSVNGGGIFALNNNGLGSLNMTGGNVVVEIESGGIAFNSLGNLSSYLSSFVTGSGTLEINLKAQNSKLAVLDSPLLPITLSSITSSYAPGAWITPQVQISSSSSANYTPFSVLKGTLNVDGNVNLDNPNGMYNRADFVNSSVRVLLGNTISGTQSGQLGIGQKNYSGGLLGNIVIQNDGTLNLSGSGSTGIAVDFGQVNNAGTLNVGNSGVGIYGGNSSQVINNGTINLTNTGTGIYGVNYFDGVTAASTLGYGSDGINITNNGVIKSTGTTSGNVGIYADNKTVGSISNVTLGSGTNIDVSSAAGSVGIYMSNNGSNPSGNSVLTMNGGTITTGTNGIGVYADNTNGVINGTTMVLNGDKSIGYYLKNGSTFTGTGGNVQINGREVTVVVTDSTSTLSTVSPLTITSTPGSTYTYGNLSGGVYTNSTAVSLGANGSLINGTNTIALFSTGSNVNSTGDNVAGMILSGQTALSLPHTLGIYTVNEEGTNLDVIDLAGNSSAGMYLTNGARGRNEGEIRVTGNKSVGIYGEGTGSYVINNNGKVTLGEESTGLFLKNGIKIENTGLSEINSVNRKATGIYSENNSTVLNSGKIELLGEESLGIYTLGAQTITNTGTVKIGNSSSLSNPGIGIYNDTSGNTIINSVGSLVEVGSNSIGIYDINGTVNNDGTIKAGDSGTGIYSKGGILNLNSGLLEIGGNNGAGVYAEDLTGPLVNNMSVNIGAATSGGVTTGSYGFILSGATTPVFVNNGSGIMSDGGVFLYSDIGGTATNNAPLTMTGSNNIAYYITNGGTITNNNVITGTVGTANIGIYNKAVYDSGGSLLAEGYIENNGNILLGDSNLVEKTDIYGAKYKSGYSVGIYGEGSSVKNSASSTIQTGADGIGMYVKDATATTYNYGTIIGNGDRSIGILAENTRVENYGLIDMYGKDVIGIAGTDAHIINETSGIIRISGEGATGIYIAGNTKVENKGVIDITSTGTTENVGIRYATNSKGITNTGTINMNGSGRDIASSSPEYVLPQMINSGLINIHVDDDKFSFSGVQLVVKVDPKKIIQTPGTNEYMTDSVAFRADGGGKISMPSEPIQITPDFTQGTSASRYVFLDVFSGFSGKGQYVSQSLTWDATADPNNASNIIMTKLAYNKFTDGLWFEDFGKSLDEKYGTTGLSEEGIKIFNKLDYITNEGDFRNVMASLAGNVYANINQREADIAKTFENSLDFIENSANNTKENVKVNIIAGKGKNSEDTDGVVGYDYSTAGVLGLREVERTYRHTFGYSLGYLHTGFEFNDGNDSEEWVDTIQLGVHSKYSVNDWKLRNDLTGRVSFHNVDRNLDWSAPLGRSEMNGTFETYSITSDNILGREFALGKNTSITPYGAFRAMYVTRPTFNETGLEALEVEGNDAWSVKPRAGIELKASLPLGPKTAWQLKGIIDLAYEYELADFNEREKARLIAVEDGYHDLSKPEDEKGTFRTRAALGAEVEDRYGIFLTGEYGIGNSDQDDYRAGVTLKAVF